MGQPQPSISKTANVLKTEITFNFTDTDGILREAKVMRDETNPNYWEVSVDGVQIQESKGLEDFLLCEKDENGNTTIGGSQYSCHVIEATSEGSLILGNRICPLFLNPPGIVINL